MSSSNIVIRTRYKKNYDVKKHIKKWNDYVSKKEKADSTSLDEKNIMKEYFSLVDTKNILFEECESYCWGVNGDVNVKHELKNLNIDNNGYIWNLVISFPPEFAFSHGLITKSDYFDLTKYIMPSLITDMGLSLDNTIWYSALHRNTKNPHMHIMIYEKEKTAESGFIPKSAIHNIKSNIANYLVDSTKFYELRDKEFSNIVGGASLNELTKIKNQRLYSDKFRKELNNRLLELYNKLPPIGRLQYNSKNMFPYKKDLDNIINFILLHDSIKYQYANYIKLLEEHQKELNNMYGMTKDNKKRKYYNDQINRLYSQIGNEILSNFKKYQSLNTIEREKNFLKKHIKELNFKSRSDYKKEETKYNIAKELYKLCMLADLNQHEIKKVFLKWIQNSKYDLDINMVLNMSIVLDEEMSATEFYKSLKNLGYNYERYNKIKTKNFYQELDYKRFVNRAMQHLMYELEVEEKQIIAQMQYELEEYK